MCVVGTEECKREAGLPFAPWRSEVTMCCLETRSKPKIGLNSVHFLIKH